MPPTVEPDQCRGNIIISPDVSSPAEGYANSSSGRPTDRTITDKERTMETTCIPRDELKAILVTGSATVVMVMGDWAYAMAHIPGTVPATTVADVRTAVALTEDIVVYFTGGACTRSLAVARQLVNLGYRRVRHYTGGLTDLAAAGEAMDGALAA